MLSLSHVLHYPMLSHSLTSFSLQNLMCLFLMHYLGFFLPNYFKSSLLSKLDSILSALTVLLLPTRVLDYLLLLTTKISLWFLVCWLARAASLTYGQIVMSLLPTLAYHLFGATNWLLVDGTTLLLLMSLATTLLP